MGIFAHAARELRDVAGARTATHRRLRDRLVVVLVATIGVNLVCGIAAYLLERHAHGSEIRTLGSALFWTSTQLLTVSSSLTNPVSAGARLLDIAMEAYAIVVVATLAGSLGSFFVKRGEEAADEEATRTARR